MYWPAAQQFCQNKGGRLPKEDDITIQHLNDPSISWYVGSWQGSPDTYMTWNLFSYSYSLLRIKCDFICVDYKGELIQ